MKKLILILLGVLLLFYVSRAWGSEDVTCPKDSGWTKIDGTMPSYTTEGDIIIEVCVKGGQDKVFFTENGDNGCWKVMGIGTTSAYAQKIGEGRECKDISHASFLVGIMPTTLPTETITPSEVTPTPTEIIPTPTVNQVATPEPTHEIVVAPTTTLLPTTFVEEKEESISSIPQSELCRMTKGGLCL